MNKKLRVVIIIFSWLLVFLNIAIILRFSMQSGTESSETVSQVVEGTIGKENFDKLADKYSKDGLMFFIRKCGHYLEFTSLGFFIYLAYANTWSFAKKFNWLFAFGSGILIAVIDEISQAFSDNRVPAVRDVLIDSMGVLSGTFLAMLFLLILFSILRKTKKLE